MSRTKKQKKLPGTEYWSKRPFNKHGQTPGAYSKHRTHKAERAEGRAEAQADAEPPNAARER